MELKSDPLTDADPGSGESPRVEMDGSAHRRTVRLTDSPSNNDVPRKILQEAGVEFSFAASSREAQGLLNSQTRFFDLVISDVSRRDTTDIDGIKFAQTVVRGTTPVILYVLESRERQLGVPQDVYAIASRPDRLIHFVFDALERGGAPYPSAYQYSVLNSAAH